MISTHLFAASEAGLLFLLIESSPSSFSMGSTHGLIADNDPMASIYNPAALGYFAQNNFLGYRYYPENNFWVQVVSNLHFEEHRAEVKTSGFSPFAENKYKSYIVRLSYVHF